MDPEWTVLTNRGLHFCIPSARFWCCCSKVLVQPIEKIIHKSNSTEKFKNILRHELELKWIKRLQTPFPLGFNDNIYHEGNISKMPDSDAFSLLDIKKRNKRSHGKR